jgi:hypothetical protein
MAADCDDDEAPAVAPTCHFALRIVAIDLAHSTPTAELDPIVSPLTHRELRQVPLVRVFGGTPRGQKACVHFHGFFRSFYVTFDGERTDEASLRELANELEDQLRQSGDGQQQQPQQHLGANQALVYNLSVVSRTPAVESLGSSMRDIAYAGVTDGSASSVGLLPLEAAAAAAAMVSHSRS